MLIMLYQHLAASLVDRCQTLIYGAPRGALRGSKKHPSLFQNSNAALTPATISFQLQSRWQQVLSMNYSLFAPALYS